MSESPHPHKTVRVLVCGEQHRGDDAAALLAAGRLPGAAAALVDVVEVGQLSVEALLDVPESVSVIVADAAVGVAAGQVVALPLSEVTQRGAGVTLASSHLLPPDQILALAEEIRGSPLRGSFVGIGGAEFGLGERLSPAVEEGLPAFTEALAGAIRSLSGPLP